MKPTVSDGPPDPGSAHCLDELIDCLRALKLWAGDPSYDTITRRVNERRRSDGRPVDELARRGTVVDCFKTGRRRINAGPSGGADPAEGPGRVDRGAGPGRSRCDRTRRAGLCAGRDGRGR
ncbi:hypothetical protein Vlu01_12120 [Micromonospora lutea]|uniref:Uncharacterized protein n=1 Tax=Micromonospora lutea TaxID=419825 RepID=A0ABQ4IRN4_9ACTN|nr:hypothetical protein Vlu01_12120 [Micromonospora lutea]